MARHIDTLTFKLSRVAHGSRNTLETFEETGLQAEAQKNREVLLPGVDIATAYAMRQVVQGTVNGKPMGVRAQRLRNVYDHGESKVLNEAQDADDDSGERFQQLFDTAHAERGWAVFMPEAWVGLPHVVRYFDLIEKGEAPDTSLLEWLVSAGAVRPATARQTLERFKKRVSVGRHHFVLNDDDTLRLRLAAEVREQLEAEECVANG